MKMSKPVKKIQSNEYDTLAQFLKNNENNKLTHLVIPVNHKTPFLKEIFHNEINYPFLKNVYNSQENGFNNEIKIFEIDYEKFYEAEIENLRWGLNG